MSSTLSAAKLGVILGAAVGVDTLAYRVPACLSCLVIVLCLAVLLARYYHSRAGRRLRARGYYAYRWLRAQPVSRRVLVPCILLVCQPRPKVDAHLHHFCYPND